MRNVIGQRDRALGGKRAKNEAAALRHKTGLIPDERLIAANIATQLHGEPSGGCGEPARSCPHHLIGFTADPAGEFTRAQENRHRQLRQRRRVRAIELHAGHAVHAHAVDRLKCPALQDCGAGIGIVVVKANFAFAIDGQRRPVAFGKLRALIAGL